MKVLLFHQFVNHNQLVGALYEHLNKGGVVADSFNISTWEFKSKVQKLPIHLIILKLVLFHYKLRLFTFSRFPFLFNSLIKRYSIIDIHFFGTFYYLMINQLKKLKRKVKITVWGSDFYRAKDSRKEKQRQFYKKVDCIQVATLQVKRDFINYYAEFDEKIRIAHFGLNTYDVITRISKNENRTTTRDFFDLPQDKIIITCGSNGIEQQQHLHIIDAIENLDQEIKKKAFVLVPMTYGLDIDYKAVVEKQLVKLKIPYKILDQNLTIENICRLRIITDIAINIQKTDAFSATIQEHLFAKNVLIVGDWLPYSKLDDFNVFYFRTEKESLNQKIEYCITNFTTLKEETKNNIERMNAITSWNANLKNWIAIYSEMS